MIKCCFNGETSNFQISMLEATKTLPLNFQFSEKFLQIKSSLKAIGIIEPILVFIDPEKNSIKILDGHLRIEALKELGEEKVECLISTIYDTYTPNKKVNQITIIQIQKMLKDAVKAGVPVELISTALNISVESLKGKLAILNGISPEVIDILSEKNVPKSTFQNLKKMIPLRQLECANMMVKFENYTQGFSNSLLQSSPKETLINIKYRENNSNKGKRKRIERLEKEMAHIHIDTEKLKENFGSDSLKLTIVISHVKKLLENQKLFRWLHKNRQDLLDELVKISEIDKLK
ncbi:ParB/RepB/Spo0J family partition protein [Rosenbergiella nectarea]|uniref:ParB/RepB/Spo0J family partition protein n=1 Tax=Rosenbergiella nectarea TaxID=988801 RepID=UPI001F4D5C7A|nr:plasmid partitioning protein RepB C-terminal domain-containing protein [Rosenbergiella nectarea]